MIILIIFKKEPHNSDQLFIAHACI